MNEMSLSHLRDKLPHVFPLPVGLVKSCVVVFQQVEVEHHLSVLPKFASVARGPLDVLEPAHHFIGFECGEARSQCVVKLSALKLAA